MSDQEVDTTQTEPQDLSVKRPRTDEPEEDNELTVDQQMTTNDESSNESNTAADCDSTTPNPLPTTPEKKAPISDVIVRYMTNLYEKKVFWDQVIDDSKSNDVLEALKKSLTFKEIDVEEVIKNKNKRQVVVNCDTDLKHLLTKLKYINELKEGIINKTKAKINSYKMGDFDKEDK